MTFGDAALLLPIATALHVAEEWPRFPRWARRFASAGYSDRKYLTMHAFTLAGSVVVALLLRTRPAPSVIVVVLALWVGPGMLCNAVFHVGASVRYRTYCPGAVTGAILYVPLCWMLVTLALREQLLDVSGLVAVCAVAPVVHTLEVGHSVFERW